jgi:hypothetical protein
MRLGQWRFFPVIRSSGSGPGTCTHPPAKIYSTPSKITPFLPPVSCYQHDPQGMPLTPTENALLFPYIPEIRQILDIQTSLLAASQYGVFSEIL